MEQATIVLNVTSQTFKNGERLPHSVLFSGMGVGGGNRSPQLSWSGAPAGVKSYAIILHDPDAPTGTGFFHWVLFNIPGSVTELPEDTGNSSGKNLPSGAVHGHTDFGVHHYGGPAPPPGHGPHHYHFMVYALDTPKLDLDETTTAAKLRFFMLGHTLAQGEIMGMYER